jgi:hypothetical protein
MLVDYFDECWFGEGYRHQAFIGPQTMRDSSGLRQVV